MAAVEKLPEKSSDGDLQDSSSLTPISSTHMADTQSPTADASSSQYGGDDAKLGKGDDIDKTKQSRPNHHKKWFPRHRLRVSIRTQLISLVLFVALFSLLTLAVVTGVYFSQNTTKTNASKLEVEAQLKAAQMVQGYNYYFYQASLLSSKDTILTALAYRKAGNSSGSAIEAAESTIQAFLESATMFNGARLYDPSYDVLVNVSTQVTTNGTNVTANVDPLYVLDQTDLKHPPDGLAANGGFVWGPILDGTDYYSSLTVQIITNSTFLLSERTLGGYLTIILNSTVLESASDDTSIASDTEQVRFFKPDSELTNASNISGFSYVFDPDSDIDISETFPLDSYKPVEDVFQGGETLGHVLNVKNPEGKKVSVGYSTVNFTYGNWAVTVEQDEQHFMQPITKLKKMMTGVCIGLSFLMCLITFVLAHYGVRPILKLQKATEQITEGRGLRSGKKGGKSSRNQRFKGHNSMGTFFKKSSSPTTPGTGSGPASTPTPLPTTPSGPNAPTGAATAVAATAVAATAVAPSSSTNEKMLVEMPANHAHSNSMATASSRNNQLALYNGQSTNIESTPDYHASASSIVTNSESRQASEGLPDMPPATEVNSAVYNDSVPPLPAIVPTRGIFYDELTELTEAFNTMTEELDRQYAHLEDRVRARTRELQVAKVQADAARQQAEDANEAKTVFIANISHELRTPLNGILGMCSVAMAEKDMNKLQSSLELIFRSGELLLHILTQLLTFSKNQLDKSKLQKKNFVIREVAMQIESIFGKSAKDQNVNLVINIKPNISRKMVLLGDSNRIIQVVMNLVSNSLKFTPEDGTVKVVLKVLGEYDKERSEKANYEHVYVKDEEKAPEDVPPHHPAQLKKTQTSMSVSTASSVQNTLSSLTSAVYNTAMAWAYGAETTETEYFDEEDDTFTKAPDSEEVAHYKRCYNFKKTTNFWVLRISVSDTGTGIDESLQDKIFEAFVQGDQTLSRSHGGTGLGLSICKQFAKMMHGTLTLNSAVGEGSTFTFTIPLPEIGELIIDDDDLESFYDDEFNETHQSKKVTFVEDEVDSGSSLTASGSGSAAASKTTPVDSPIGQLKKRQSQSSLDARSNVSSDFEKSEMFTRASTGTAKRDSKTNLSDTSGSPTSMRVTPTVVTKVSPKRFLVAEDNLVNQEVVKRMLKLEGYTDVTLAYDGLEAINLVVDAEKRDEPFDLVLMDVQMPRLDGIAATRILRQDLRYDRPIVALTAFADKSNEAVCNDVGMSGFLAKPIRRNLLRVILKTFCGTDSETSSDSQEDKVELSSPPSPDSAPSPSGSAPASTDS